MSNRAWSIVDITAMCLIPLSFLAAWRWDWFHDYAAHEPVRVWVLQIGLLLVFAVSLGLSKDRGPLGVVIDEANRVSLSRLQTFIWTVLLIGGIATAISVNLARDCHEPAEGVTPAEGSCAQSPFAIDLPDQLLTLAGISAGALGAGTVIGAQNRSRNPSRASFDDETGVRSDPVAEEMRAAGYVPMGITAGKPSPQDATLGDLVRGDVETDYYSLDLTRIQFLAFTLILAGGYAITFAQGLNQNPQQPIATFPGFDSGLNILLAISATTYAGTKAFRSTAIR